MREAVANDIPVAVDAGALPATSELARFRDDIRKGKVPDLTVPTPAEPATAATPPVESTKPPAPAPAVTAKDDDDPGAVAPSKRQQYINELIRAQTRAELERDQLRAELDTVRGTVAPAAPTAPEDTRPKPQESDVGTKYETYAAYVEDVADWKLEQREAARTRTEQATQQSEAERDALTAYASKIPAAQARYADFNEVVTRPLPAPLTPTLRRALLHAELGPDLAYYLTTHPDEYLRIRALPVGPALMAMGRLEAQLPSAITTPATAPRSPVTPPAAPMPPVGGHATAGTPDASKVNDLHTFRTVIKPKFGMRG